MISILMPLHNGAEFLSESINSVISQTFKDWELIVCINGLTSIKSNQIIRELNAFQDKRIRYIVTNKKGKCRSLNKARYFAKYDNICLLDVDDTWNSDKLEKQVKFIDKYDVVGSDVEYSGEHSGSPGLFLGKLSKPMFSWQNPLINSMVMLKKKYAVWNEEHEGLDDYNLWLDLLDRNKTFYNIPEILGQHRIHKKSYFNNKNKDLSDNLKLYRLKPLSEEDKVKLTEIMDNKKWEL